jgi:predicted PurR-regulated permease PerM
LVIVGAYIIWYTRDIFEPLIISAVLAYVLNPFVSFLAKRTKLSRPLVITIAFLIGIIVFSFLISILLPPLVTDIGILIADIQLILAQIQEFVSQPIIFLDQEYHLENLFPDFTQLLSDSVLTLPENAFHIIEATTKNLLWALIVLVSTYYLLRDWTKMRSWFLHLVPEPYQPDARRIYQEIKQVWHGYLKGNLALMVIVGIVFSLAWISIGVPAALVLGIITGVLTIIPDLGPAIAAVLAILVAFFEGSTYLQISNSWFALLVAGIYLVLINIKSIWLRPRVFGRSVHMHEGVVFIAIMVAVVIQGVLGALIIIPLLASASIMARYIYRMIQDVPPWPKEEDIIV